MYASENGLFQIVNLLVKQNDRLDPNLVDGYDRTALMYASKNDHILCIDELLKHSKIKVQAVDRVRI